MSGTDLFSGFEVIRAAMEVEKNGRRFYTSMAERAEHPLARELFSWLAQDEVEHLRTLEELLPRYQEGSFWENEAEFLPYLRQFKEREVFPSAERLEAALRTEQPDLAAIDLAIEAEERFAEYFATAAANARSDDGRQAFGWLAEEEQRHARVLKERRAQLQD